MKSKAELNQLAKSMQPAIEAAVNAATDKVLTIKMVAEMLGVSKWAIYTRCRNNQIPFKKKNGRLYFSKNEITSYYLNS